MDVIKYLINMLLLFITSLLTSLLIIISKKEIKNE